MTMYPRIEYQMTEAELRKLLNACKPVPAMMIGSRPAASRQENANAAWARLGKKMGFDSMTVRPVPGKTMHFFTAVPSETEEARKERLAKEAEEKRQSDIARLEAEIAERTKQLAALQTEE